MYSTEKIIKELSGLASPKTKLIQERFGITDVHSLGLTTPQMRIVAKQIGKDHQLALQLWKTGIHEARHVAIFIADAKQVTELLMEQWLQDFGSWDIVDNCCGTILIKTPAAFQKAVEWSIREKEFEKRAGFVIMAELAIHDKNSEDKKYEQFFPLIISESSDNRNFVRKAINWALRQIGKRNTRLCKSAIEIANQISQKEDSASRWIAAGALRELGLYLREGRIKNIGQP